jgi:type II secretory pathway pseudopilin PulG
MNRTGSTLPQNPQGSALVLSLVFIAVFAGLATALLTVSGASVQLAENLRKADTTRASAESGLEVMRYWLSQVVLTAAPEERFNELETILRSQLPANLADRLTRDGSTMRITDVPLLSSTGQSFTAVLTSVDANNIELGITGHYGSLGRTVSSGFVLTQRADNVFNFGVATKGPLNLTGNVDLDGYTLEVESNAYIDTDYQPALTIIGNCSMGGEVNLRNSDPDLYLQGNYSIGGERGEDALNHIHPGVTPSDFPDMNPTPFFSYATGPNGHTLSPTDPTSGASYENLYIPGGRNPSFSGNMTLKGVIYIETPNVVTFSGNLSITAIIVTNGRQDDNSGDNQINFTGNITAHPITELPQETKFAGLHSQTGTFLLTPGFKASFGGNFGTLSGVIAANGLCFDGSAGGTINGSIVNYSNAALEMSGNSDLRFNRSGLSEIPAGFVPRTVMQYIPSSYSECGL